MSDELGVKNSYIKKAISLEQIRLHIAKWL